MLVGNLNGFVVAFAAAKTETECHPAVRDEVQGRDDLGQVRRVARVAEQDRCAQPDSLCSSSRCGEYGQGFKVVIGDPVDGPHRMATHRLAFHGEVDDVLGFR